MINPEVFKELQNRSIITQVGLSPDMFNDITELQNLGLVTDTYSDEVYDLIVNEINNKVNYTNTFLESIATGGKIILENDIILSSPIIIEKNVELDLNGYTITNIPWDEDGELNSYVFWVKNGKLTINGTGNVISPSSVYSMAVWANGGDVEINGGEYKNGGDSCDLIYVSKKGTITINNGKFIASGPASGLAPGTKNPYSALNIKDKDKLNCKINVKGGNFYKFNPADNLSENPKMNFVATGYESVKEGDWFIVKELKEIIVDDGNE